MNRAQEDSAQCEQCAIVRQLRQAKDFQQEELEEARQIIARKNVEHGQQMQQLHDFYRRREATQAAERKAETEELKRQNSQLKRRVAVVEKERDRSGKNRPDKFDGEDLEAPSGSKEDGAKRREGRKDGDPTEREKRQGHANGGRKNNENLPKDTQVKQVEAPICCDTPMQKERKLPYRISRTVHVMLEAFVHELHRERALFRCACCGRETLAEASAPPGVLNSKYSLQTHVQQLVDHIRHQIPVHRLARRLQDLGLRHISDGTIFSAFSTLSGLLAPLDQAIIQRSQQADCFEVDCSGIPVRDEDETDQRQDMESNHWPLWQIRTIDTVVYMLTSRQRADDLLVYFAPVLDRISRTGPVRIMADRGKNIRVLEQLGFLVAFCWAHVRRDFIKLGRSNPDHLTFARKWVGIIKTGFRLDRQRRSKPSGSAQWKEADAELRAHIQDSRDELLRSLRDPQLPAKQRKVLNSLEEHWHGLILFLDHLCLPMHNNNVERGYRWLALFRRISFACSNKERAHDRARFYTILQTLELHDINPVPYLCAFLQEQADWKNKASQMSIKEWMPWSLSDRVRALIASTQ